MHPVLVLAALLARAPRDAAEGRHAHPKHPLINNGSICCSTVFSGFSWMEIATLEVGLFFMINIAGLFLIGLASFAFVWIRARPQRTQIH